MDRAIAVACLSGLLLASCGGHTRIVVGSKNFTEQLILGEILAQQIERRMGVAVERRLDLGGTLLAHEALVAGSIDLYPEYTGTALTAVLKQPPQNDAAAVLAEVRGAYRARWKLAWLPPLGFNDTFAMVVRAETARNDGLATLSAAARAGPWRLGVGYEFEQRPDGLAGLEKAYGLCGWRPRHHGLGAALPGAQQPEGRYDRGQFHRRAAAAMDVTVLADDRHYFPPYDCAVVAREETLARYPALRAVLEQLSGKITAETMRRLNRQVEADRRPAVQVAEEFLNGLR